MGLWGGDWGPKRSWGWDLIWQDWCPYKKRKRPRVLYSSLTQRKGPMRTQREGGHLWARKSSLTTNEPHNTLILDIWPPEQRENKLISWYFCYTALPNTKELMLFNCGAGEDSWESLDCKEIKPVHPKGNQPWIVIGRADAEAEAPILGPPNVRTWLTGKNHNAGKDWGQEKKQATEDEVVGWYHWLNEHEFEQTPGDSEGQRSLLHYSPWVAKSWTWLSDWRTEDILYSM